MSLAGVLELPRKQLALQQQVPNHGAAVPGTANKEKHQEPVLQHICVSNEAASVQLN